MIAPARRALFFDALYQVLDNWVFRILTVLAGMVVLISFTFGFREEGVVFLFGLRTWGYDQFFALFGGMTPRGDVQGAVLEGYLSLVFDYLAGKLGVIFCIAASAFFVPQMIEKGAADVTFHKPLSRWTFYLSRYVAGLLFVGIISCLMAVGIYLGVLLVSGRNDPGILVAGPLLTYLFGLIYPVSMAIGVYTRSTVASILLTTIFFFLNGCVQFGWNRMEATRAVSTSVAEDEDRYFKLLRTTVEVLHFVLPKTSDAGRMAADMRRLAKAPIFRDEATGIAVFRMPEGVTAIANPRLPGGPAAAGLADALGAPIHGLQWSASLGGQRTTLLKRAAKVEEMERRGEPVRDVESAREAAQALIQVIESDPGVDEADRSLISFGNSSAGEAASAWAVTWWQRSSATEGAPSPRVAVVQEAAGWILTLWIEPGDEATRAPSQEPEDLDALCQALIDPADRIMGFASSPADSDRAGERHLGFDRPWRSNVFFSVGSSLAFALSILVLGWLRLRRIEF